MWHRRRASLDDTAFCCCFELFLLLLLCLLLLLRGGLLLLKSTALVYLGLQLRPDGPRRHARIPVMQTCAVATELYQ
jgi:hypothetical protein